MGTAGTAETQEWEEHIPVLKCALGVPVGRLRAEFGGSETDRDRPTEHERSHRAKNGGPRSKKGDMEIKSGLVGEPVKADFPTPTPGGTGREVGTKRRGGEGSRDPTRNVAILTMGRGASEG